MEAQTNTGGTGLLVAAQQGHNAAVEVLLAHGAAIEAQDNNGRTAYSARHMTVTMRR